MIAHLTGTILHKQADSVVVDVTGVGYRVLVPVTTLCRLGDVGSAVSLRIHTHVREDALVLFGFSEEREQALFEKLIDVAGVGPRLAVNILSGIEAPDLVLALRQSDVARLTRVPGVGKKTAERLILELKDKMVAFQSLPNEEPAPSPPGGPGEDLLLALTHLGYSRAEGERALERALKSDPDARFEDLLRQSLQLLSGR